MTTLNRRTFLAAGAAAGVTATVPHKVFASVAPRQPYINPRIMERALAAVQAKRPVLSNTDVIGIADFSKASRDPRFYIVDLRYNFLTEHLVAHGRGSDPAHCGRLERFSNEYGSNATSAGAYLTGDYYHGKYGRSMKLKGLERRNNNAEGRAIVVHSAWYAEPEVISETGKLGRSEGCFAMSYSSLQEVLARLGPGHLLYADKLA